VGSGQHRSSDVVDFATSAARGGRACRVGVVRDGGRPTGGVPVVIRGGQRLTAGQAGQGMLFRRGTVCSYHALLHYDTHTKPRAFWGLYMGVCSTCVGSLTAAAAVTRVISSSVVDSICLGGVFVLAIKWVDCYCYYNRRRVYVRKCDSQVVGVPCLGSMSALLKVLGEVKTKYRSVEYSTG
jgi:hypothetical protein